MRSNVLISFNFYVNFRECYINIFPLHCQYLSKFECTSKKVLMDIGNVQNKFYHFFEPPLKYMKIFRRYTILHP